VLHDMFDLLFGQITGITGRTPAAARPHLRERQDH